MVNQKKYLEAVQGRLSSQIEEYYRKRMFKVLAYGQFFKNLIIFKYGKLIMALQKRGQVWS